MRTGLALLVAVASAQGNTPIEKVITLLSDLKTKVELEGVAEAKTYDEFACFCRDSTKSKSTSITDGKNTIDAKSADIASLTAERNTAKADLVSSEKQLAAHKLNKSETENNLATEKSKYDAENADLTKAIQALTDAAQSIATANTAIGNVALVQLRAKLAQLTSIGKSTALLRVDPSDPGYKIRSGDISQVIDGLKQEFTTKQGQVQSDWQRLSQNLQGMIDALTTQISSEESNKQRLIALIETKKQGIGTNRQDLINADALMKDDQTYLKDLTARCEQRAGAYDQRSSMRAQEVSKLSEALEILSGSNNVVKDNAEGAASKRAATTNVVRSYSFFQNTNVEQSPSFLQVKSRSKNVLERARSWSPSVERKDKVLALLSTEGRRIGSSMLSTLAVRASAGPFDDVKNLIQKLLERLLKESEAEASKKGFCDEQLGKARTDRDYRWNDVTSIGAELGQLEAKKDELDVEKNSLIAAIDDLEKSLRTATSEREAAKAVNQKTIEDANAGAAAVAEALLILKSFYKNAAKAEVFVQYSPVDDDDTYSEASTAYKGAQEKSKGIIGLLEVIVTDFQRTSKTTHAQEEEDQSQFVLFKRTSTADIGGKETKKTLVVEDLQITEATIATKMTELQTNMDLVDAALTELKNLHKMCVDTSMLYGERVKNREDEIAALKSALCILDPQGVEADCTK